MNLTVTITSFSTFKAPEKQRKKTLCFTEINSVKQSVASVCDPLYGVEQNSPHTRLSAEP